MKKLLDSAGRSGATLPPKRYYSQPKVELDTPDRIGSYSIFTPLDFAKHCPAPFIREGADHSHILSRGVRC